jgi:hypothetical protein
MQLVERCLTDQHWNSYYAKCVHADTRDPCRAPYKRRHRNIQPRSPRHHRACIILMKLLVLAELATLYLEVSISAKLDSIEPAEHHCAKLLPYYLLRCYMCIQIRGVSCSTCTRVRRNRRRRPPCFNTSQTGPQPLPGEGEPTCPVLQTASTSQQTPSSKNRLTAAACRFHTPFYH